MYYKVGMLKTSLLKLVPFILAVSSAGVTKKKPEPLPETHPVMIRADARAAEIVEVVEAMVPDRVQQDVWERSLFGWEFWESSWFVSPHGSNDDGNACGVLQIHSPEKILPGATCEKLRKDSKLAVKVALTFLLEREKTCGSKAAAWTAFSWDGACHKETIDLVKNRCRYVGLTDKCEAKVAPAVVPSASASTPK